MFQRPPARTFFQNFLRFWLPVLLYLTVILALSAQPYLKLPIRFNNADKLYHLIEYGGLGWLLVRALRGTMRLRTPVAAAAIAIVLGSLFGAGDEYFQSFVPGRDSSPYDWMADTAGVVLAQIVYVLAVVATTPEPRSASWR